jgi:MFS family permease
MAVHTVPEADPERWRQLGILAGAMVLSMTTWFSTAAVLPQLRDELDLTSNTASLLAIAVQIGFVIGAILSATFNLADRVPSRRLVLYGSIGAAVANALILVTDGVPFAVQSRLLVGVALAAVYPPALKAMSGWFVTGRGLALGVMVGALTLGSALPHLIRSIGSPPWQLVIGLTSVLTITGGLIADRIAKDGPHVFPSARFHPGQIREVLSDRRLLLASAGYFGHMWELYAMWAWIGAFAADVFDSPAKAALLTFAIIGAGAGGSVVGGLISDRTSRTTAAGVAMAASGTVAAFIGFLVERPALVVVFGLIWGFWVVADSAQFSTIVTEVADQRFVGTALTVQLALGFILTIFTIYLVPFVRDQSSWGWAFLLLVPGPMLGVLAMARLRATPAPVTPANEPAVYVSPFF